METGPFRCNEKARSVPAVLLVWGQGLSWWGESLVRQAAVPSVLLNN